MVTSGVRLKNEHEIRGPLAGFKLLNRFVLPVGLAIGGWGWGGEGRF